MEERKKKQLIAVLLFISCLVSAWLLFITPADDSKQLKSFGQADSLFQLTLSDFNISRSQISQSSTQVDSIFTRKQYRISVPPDFSKTQLHAALQQQLSPYSISLPAQVTFPEKNMSIHLLYNNTVFQTIMLASDEELEMQRSFANLMVAFEGRPPNYLLEELMTFGEPIPIAVILRPPLQLPGWWEELEEQYPNLYIWPQTSGGENLLTGRQEQIMAALEPIMETSPDISLLHFFEDRQNASAKLSTTSFAYLSGHDAFILDAEIGQTGFNQTFRTFVQQARSGDTPLAIVMGTEESINWTRRELNTFKKGGLMLTSPRTTNF